MARPETLFRICISRLLSDNGPSYISSDLSEWLDKRNMGHVRGAPCHPQTQGKIEGGIKSSRTAPCWQGRRRSRSGGISFVRAIEIELMSR
jgi:transposase InsO family protein